jgi:hypothetical protein
LGAERLATEKVHQPMDAAAVFEGIQPSDQLSRVPLIQNRKRSWPSRTDQSNDGGRDNHRPAKAARDAAIKIRHGLRKGADGIIEAALDLYRVKQQKLIKRGQWTKWIENEVRVNIRTAEWLINIANDPDLTKPCHRHALPASIRTLYELSRIKRAQDKRRLIANGKINPGMTREEAIALRWETQKDSSIFPTSNRNKTGTSKGRCFAPEIKPEHATVLYADLELAGADVVLAAIRGLDLVPTVSLCDFDRAVCAVRRQLEDKRGVRK